MELVLLGQPISADRACSWGIVKEVVESGDSGGDVINRPFVSKALEYAEKIVANGPESVIVGRAGVLLGLNHSSTEGASWILRAIFDECLEASDNLQEGLSSFVQKRDPTWKPSKL